MMRVRKIFRSPISPDQKVSCDEIPLNTKFVHGKPPLFSEFYGSHNWSSIFFRDGHDKIERVDFCTILEIRRWELRKIWIKMKERIPRLVNASDIRGRIRF